MRFQERDIPGLRRPQELLAPLSDAGGSGLPSADQLPSSEGFDQIPFYIGVNMYHLRKAPIAQRILDAGAGTGSVIKWLDELRKIKSPFNITLVDINGLDLAKARLRLAGLVDQTRGDSMAFVKRSADRLGKIVADGSVELITALNSIHLYKYPERFFQQAWRKLQPGGELFVNTAYAKDVMFPDPIVDRRAWGSIISYARIDLKGKGHRNFEDAKDPAKFSSDQYEAMAAAAGFRVLSEVHEVRIPRDQAKSLVAVAEFARGAVPGPPLEIVREALINAVDPALNRSRAEELHRGWLFLRAIKSA